MFPGQVPGNSRALEEGREGGAEQAEKGVTHPGSEKPDQGQNTSMSPLSIGVSPPTQVFWVAGTPKSTWSPRKHHSFVKHIPPPGTTNQECSRGFRTSEVLQGC